MILDFNPEFSIQFMYNHFHPKMLKGERNYPWFKQWYNILLHTQSIVTARRLGQCLEYLGYITLHVIGLKCKFLSGI